MASRHRYFRLGTLLALMLITAACGNDSNVAARQAATSSSSSGTASSQTTSSTAGEDATQPEAGDDDACQAYHAEAEALRAELRDKDPTNLNLQSQAYDTSVDGSTVDPGPYYATVRSTLQSLPKALVPIWLPQELTVQPPGPSSFRPLPHETPVLRFDVVRWPRLPASPALTVYVEISQAPTSPLSHTITAKVGPADAVLLHRADADVIAWNLSPTLAISIEMDRFDRRINCQELLAMARSVEEYSS